MSRAEHAQSMPKADDEPVAKDEPVSQIGSPHMRADPVPAADPLRDAYARRSVDEKRDMVTKTLNAIANIQVPDEDDDFEPYFSAKIEDLSSSINNILSKIKDQSIPEQSIVHTNEVYVRQRDNTVYIVSCNRVVVPIIL